MPKELHWTASEYEFRQKTSDWYIAVVIIVISIAVSAVILNNMLFAVLIIIAMAVLFMYSKRAPKDVECSISEQGIAINKMLYPYNELEAFWVETENEKLFLRSKRITMTYITTPIGDTDSNVLRAYLKRFLKEERMQTSLPEKIMEYLGF